MTTLIECLKRASDHQKLDLSEEIITDTLNEFASEDIELIHTLANAPYDPESTSLLEQMLIELFNVAIDKKNLRTSWDLAMDEDSPVEMYLDQNGVVVFKVTK